MMCKDCQRLYEALKEQESLSYGHLKTINRLKGELKYEQTEKRKLLKELKQRGDRSNGKGLSRHRD